MTIVRDLPAARDADRETSRIGEPVIPAGRAADGLDVAGGTAADGLDVAGGAAEDGDDALPAGAGWDAGAEARGVVRGAA